MDILSSPTADDNNSLPAISNLRIQDTPNNSPASIESADHRVDSQLDSNEILSSPNLTQPHSIYDNHDYIPPTPSPDPGPNVSPKTSLRKSIKRKLKTPYNQSTPKVVRESQSPSTSQPHQSPSDAIEDDIATNNPRQFAVIQSNSPPSQTLSQDVLDEFNSSDF